jgi:DNA-binding transcriptional ArsR family regulator
MTVPDRHPARRIRNIQTIKALAHPVRVKVLAHLRDVEMASPNELATRFDTTLGTMSYHVRTGSRSP